LLGIAAVEVDLTIGLGLHSKATGKIDLGDFFPNLLLDIPN
jgi:hypothetical protein